MKLNITAVSVRSASPKVPFGQTANIPLDSGAEAGLLRATIPADIPANAVVTTADIVTRVHGALTGSRSITAQRNSADFQVSKATWNNKPGVTGSTHSTTVGAVATGTEVRIDVTADVQAFIAGSVVNHGWRLTTSDTSRVLLYGTPADKYKPYLELEYILPGDAPTDLSPDGAVISLTNPTVTFAVPDDTVSVQAKFATDEALTSVVFDSGERASPVGLLDLAVVGPVGFTTDLPFYWAARAKGANGWSDWSDVATFTRILKPTITITSPDTTTGDKTPPVTWTADDQTSWRVQVRDDVTGRLLADSGQEPGDDQEWTPPRALTRVGQTARITVFVWDDEDRVATPGDPIYATATLVTELVTLADTPGVDSLSAVAGYNPYVRLAWSAGATPDAWQIVRNGIWLDRVDGADRAFYDWNAKPGDYIYRVLPVVDSGVGPNGQSATVKLRPAGLWLYDEEEIVFLIEHDNDESWDEQAVTHDVLGDAPPVRRRSGQPPPRGTVTGFLMAGADTSRDPAAMAATAISFKGSDQGRVYRMAYGDRNIPVTIGDMQVVPAHEGDAAWTWAVSFKWWQTADEVPWDD